MYNNVNNVNNVNNSNSYLSHDNLKAANSNDLSAAAAAAAVGNLSLLPGGGGGNAVPSHVSNRYTSPTATPALPSHHSTANTSDSGAAEIVRQGRLAAGVMSREPSIEIHVPNNYPGDYAMRNNVISNRQRGMADAGPSGIHRSDSTSSSGGISNVVSNNNGASNQPGQLDRYGRALPMGRNEVGGAGISNSNHNMLSNNVGMMGDFNNQGSNPPLHSHSSSAAAAPSFVPVSAIAAAATPAAAGCAVITGNPFVTDAAADDS
uniref:Uncharacterized protein n=1 Tax=Polytomella parva TaxID=51329 RepID=A0A7S0YHJ0_9CHLO